MKSGPGKVILLEDDAFLSETIKSHIEDLGGRCECYGTVAKVEPLLNKKGPKYLISDVAVPLGAAVRITNQQARAGFAAGQAFTQLAKKHWRETKFAIVTALPNEEIANWCRANDVEYRLKPIDRLYLEQYFGLRRKRAFVVHGRNLKSIERIKIALGHAGIEAIVLMEQPSKGQTVIEKFEKISDECDLAVVALSADDLGKLKHSNEPQRTRARQNVIFELGFFCGKLKRTSGRVVLVDFGIRDLPSDLAGVIRLNGNASLKSFCKELNRELK